MVLGRVGNGSLGRLLLFIHTKLPAAKSLMPVGLQNPLRKLIQSVPLRPEMQPFAPVLSLFTIFLLFLPFPSAFCGQNVCGCGCGCGCGRGVSTMGM